MSLQCCVIVLACMTSFCAAFSRFWIAVDASGHPKVWHNIWRTVSRRRHWVECGWRCMWRGQQTWCVHRCTGPRELAARSIVVKGRSILRWDLLWVSLPAKWVVRLRFCFWKMYGASNALTEYQQHFSRWRRTRFQERLTILNLECKVAFNSRVCCLFQTVIVLIFQKSDAGFKFSTWFLIVVTSQWGKHW